MAAKEWNCSISNFVFQSSLFGTIRHGKSFGGHNKNHSTKFSSIHFNFEKIIIFTQNIFGSLRNYKLLAKIRQCLPRFEKKK